MPEVLDAPALLVWLQSERGADRVEREGAVMNGVNWSDVLQKAEQNGVVVTGMRGDLEALGLELRPFGLEEAERGAELYPLTSPHGLSLADRACLATAVLTGATAVTAERAWSKAHHGVAVRVIR